MCGPAAVIPLAIAATAVTAAGAIYQGNVAAAQGKYEAAVANQNAKMERAASDDARQRGETEQLRHYRRVAQVLGAQRAQLAAGGLDVTFGSAADLQGDTMALGLEDSAIIAENTRREMQGYDISAVNYTAQGRAARMRGNAARVGGYVSAASTILGGASQVGQIKAGRNPAGAR